MNKQLQEAIRLREKGKGEASRLILVGLVQKEPANAEFLYQCAWTHDGLGLEREAVDFYERALANHLAKEDQPGAYLGLGSTLRALGDFAKAASILQKGSRLFPEHKALQVFLAMALYNNGDAKTALSQLLNLLVTTSNDPGIQEFKRAILFYAEDLDRIEES